MTSHELSRVILDILIVLIAAKAGGEIAERLRQPAVLGELVVGIMVGPSLLGWIDSTPVLTALAQLGVILLLFEVGLETDFDEVMRVGGIAMRVGVVGVALPFGLGYGGAIALGYSNLVGAFIGATLTATSVGITARVLSDMRKLGTNEGRIVIGAAVVDDVIGLIILAVMSGLAAGNGISIWAVVRTVFVAVAFLIVTLIAGQRVMPPLFRALSQRLRVRGILTTAAFSFCLVLAYSAEKLGLASIVGAFGAGVILSHTDQHREIRDRLTPVADLFIPIFFLSMGVLINARSLVKPSVLGLAGLLTAAAVVGKVLSGWVAPSSMSRLAIGTGMIPRGEVGVIFASFGLVSGVFTDDLYSAMLLVITLTTFLAPPLLHPAFSRLELPRGRQPERLAVPRSPVGSVKLGPRW